MQPAILDQVVGEPVAADFVRRLVVRRDREAFVLDRDARQEFALQRRRDRHLHFETDATTTLVEALEGLRVLSKNASGGKVTPNVIVKGEELGQRKLSLSLTNVPLTEALNYVTQLVGAKATYDKHAIILSTQADTTTSTAVAPPK